MTAQQTDILQTPIEFLKGVGEKRGAVLRKEFNIQTFNDLLYYFPYRHIDKSHVYHVSDIVNDGGFILLRGTIRDVRLVGQNRSQRLTATFSDETGSIELVWFNGIRWVSDVLRSRKEFVIFGKPTLFNGRWNITHPELIDPNQQESSPISLRFQPMYNTSDVSKRKSLDSKAIAKLTANLLTQVKDVIPETMPREMVEELHLLPLRDALVNIHYPEDNQKLSQATLRLKFDELFFTQLKMLKLKLINTNRFKGFVFKQVGHYFNTFYKECLTFDLTNAQKRVLREIRGDVGSGHQMNRLLQGDVGSGKTIIAVFSMLLAKDNGFQACMMAPTEILATQHYEKISKQLEPLGLQVEFLSGSTKSAQRKRILNDLQNGQVDILIGTHALIEDNVVFNKLGLVVIDEQHRFGVEQRARLWRKSGTVPPHILVMTATPIPRTLAMTLYGDLDVSVIDELPSGRKPIVTTHFYEKDRLKVFGFMQKQIAEGRQVYVVYPLIQESETMDLLDLQAGYEAIERSFPPPTYSIGVVHGRMKAEEKDFIMEHFKKNEIQILLSTTVIEVGIDVPNATVMVIENAERFGLSQLHQLRGRVGRGGNQSYCILMSKYELSNEGRKRLDAMVETNDGFEIANFDLQLRGPGDIQGTRQSGMLDFKIADLTKDEKLVAYTRSYAQQILEKDPDLSLPEHARLAETLQKLMQRDTNWSVIS
ncbi:MAG: ATP-dependent DNA helicase RecG [Bacteroidales bacterium]|nr:ATP-dependent DNA helicase RecG [Bacteroidales bacterium]MBR6176011.1 ATP-dependent DNA helicase RecG [Bacteroidales bacterium]